MGIPVESTVTLTTFNDCKEIIEKLRQRGMMELIVRYLGWTKSDITMGMQGKADVLGELGGMKGLENLAEYTLNRDVKLFLDFDALNFDHGSWFMSGYLHSAKNISGFPAKQYNFKLNTYLRDIQSGFWYLLKPSRVGDSIEKFLYSLNNVHNIGYSLSAISNTVYSDFSTNGMGRQQSADQLRRVLLDVSTKEELMLESANGYALPYGDCIVDVPAWSSSYDTADRQIPFYQIAVRGLVPYSEQSINLTSNPTDSFLRAVETGAMLKYSWIFNDTSLLNDTSNMEYFAADYSQWLDRAEEQYKQTIELYALIEGQRIASHREISNEVYETIYDNNVKVIVNYGFQDFKDKDVYVKAKSFAIKEE